MGYRLWGRAESDMTEVRQQQQQQHLCVAERTAVQTQTEASASRQGTRHTIFMGLDHTHDAN